MGQMPQAKASCDIGDDWGFWLFFWIMSCNRMTDTLITDALPVTVLLRSA
jgi:hypothetical protein